MIIRNTAEWTRIFHANSGPRDFGPEQGDLTPDEQAAITSSIQEFQLGESGEGSHIMRQAKIHAARDGDPEYLVALRLFIAEEIRHSRELKAFMDAHNIMTLKRTSADSAFRFARRLAGLELSIMVLVAAEIVARVYYAALAAATSSTVLKKLCEQILHDEKAHVEFQCERLAILRRHLSPFALGWRSLLYPLMFRVVLMLIWIRHGRAMRAGRYTFPRFYRHSLVELRIAMKIMNPRNYDWQDARRPGFLVGRIRSIQCALLGIGHVIRTQKNAWLHLAATIAVVFTASLLKLAPGEWCWLIVAIVAVWSAESLNTALELLCDVTCPTPNPTVGKAKDVAAASVLLTSLAATAIAVLILLPHVYSSIR